MIRGIFAFMALLAVAMIPAAAQAAVPTVNFCSGVKDGNYDFAAIQFAQQAKGILNVNVINTAGSLENLTKIDKGECDAAIVQSDAYGVYMKQNSHSSLNIERGRALYSEYVHFICNSAAKITRITQLTAANTVLIGANGGGTSVTWDSFKLADAKRYGPVQTLPIGGLRAVNKVQEGSDAQCMMYVTGLKSASINEANKVALNSSGRLVLVAADDGDLPGLKDPKGKPIYTKLDIPSGTYPGGLQPSALFGSSVSTIAVEAVFVTNSNYIDAHEGDYNSLLRAVNNAMPAVMARVTPK